eukprot:CAMPEP_0181034370 /NCGR_PEP_ID=MMETSP1070-20121207/7774_1 /TAXON_ID=265543 /ORGANISM="Minutocellus polymorphus, Strain NH13" /LENGTH=68 /DNA_ID=CAMNT_0023111899 /DNA_START=73 /DNA_END=275 /DNA_ORIENTATION=+
MKLSGAASLLVLAATSGCSAFGTTSSSPSITTVSSQSSLQRGFSNASPAFLPRQISGSARLSPIANLP